MSNVLSPVQVKRHYHRRKPPVMRWPDRIEFRAHPDDVALLAAYATATKQKPGAVMRNLMEMLREQYRELQKTRAEETP